eukprot:scaffold1163_cov362-Prasinococcus_capsulatus_cf.AAC.5
MLPVAATWAPAHGALLASKRVACKEMLRKPSGEGGPAKYTPPPDCCARLSASVALSRLHQPSSE